MSSIDNIETIKNTDTKKILNTFKKYQNKVNLELEKYISSNFPTCIQPMINYMVGGGKRLRSILTLLFGNIEDIMDDKMIIDMSISIELIHCLSLVIDDTPSMDNDDYRRDMPSFHKQYGMIKTNLTIYYLLNKITLLFSKYDLKDTSLIDIVNLNLNHLLEGQCLDINLNQNEIINYDSKYYDKKKYLDSKTFKGEYQKIFDLLPNCFDSNTMVLFIKNINLNFLKTSSLFCLSIISPMFINCNSTNEKYENVMNELKIWSNLFGLVFQYSDDILDIEQDRLSNNPNITFIIGKQQTVSFIMNSLKYLKSNLPTILKQMNIYSTYKINVINEIFDLIKKRCDKVTPL